MGLACSGCTNFDPAGVADPAYLLVDGEIRASGGQIQIDGRPHVSSLPTELDAWASQVVVIAGWGRRDVSLILGHLSYVRGGDRRVEMWEFDTVVRTDVVGLTTSGRRPRGWPRPWAHPTLYVYICGTWVNR